MNSIALVQKYAQRIPKAEGLATSCIAGAVAHRALPAALVPMAFAASSALYDRKLRHEYTASPLRTPCRDRTTTAAHCTQGSGKTA